jgi:hypothetical protein
MSTSDIEEGKTIRARQEKAAQKNLELRESFEEAIRKYVSSWILMLFLNEGQQLSMELPPALATEDFYGRLRSILRSLEAAEERMAKMEVLLKMMELESLMRADPGHYDAVFGVYKTAFLSPVFPSAELEGEYGKLFWAEWRFLTNASGEIADYLVSLSSRLGIDYQRFSEPYKGSAKPQYPVSGNEAIWVKWRSSQ